MGGKEGFVDVRILTDAHIVEEVGFNRQLGLVSLMALPAVRLPKDSFVAKMHDWLKDMTGVPIAEQKLWLWLEGRAPSGWTRHFFMPLDTKPHCSAADPILRCLTLRTPEVWDPALSAGLERVGNIFVTLRDTSRHRELATAPPVDWLSWTPPSLQAEGASDLLFFIKWYDRPQSRLRYAGTVRVPPSLSLPATCRMVTDFLRYRGMHRLYPPPAADAGCAYEIHVEGLEKMPLRRLPIGGALRADGVGEDLEGRADGVGEHGGEGGSGGGSSRGEGGRTEGGRGGRQGPGSKVQEGQQLSLAQLGLTAGDVLIFEALTLTPFVWAESAAGMATTAAWASSDYRNVHSLQGADGTFRWPAGTSPGSVQTTTVKTTITGS